MAFLMVTTSLPAVYRPNGYARTTTAGTPHARANCGHIIKERKTLNICFDFFLKHLSEKEEIIILDGIS